MVAVPDNCSRHGSQVKLLCILHAIGPRFKVSRLSVIFFILFKDSLFFHAYCTEPEQPGVCKTGSNRYMFVGPIFRQEGA